jgi:hypothetical protein
MPDISPATQLVGKILDGGWKVVERLQRSPGATGGHFSEGYYAVNGNGDRAYVKALDFSEALKAPDPVRMMQAMTTAFNFERDLVQTCSQRKMRRVVLAVADGTLRPESNGSAPIPVPYIIFELANTDIRNLMATGNFDAA